MLERDLVQLAGRVEADPRVGRLRGYPELPEHSLNAAKFACPGRAAVERAGATSATRPAVGPAVLLEVADQVVRVGRVDRDLNGSTSVLSYTTPPSDCPAVQARNGLVPLTSTASSKSYGAAPTPLAAMADTTSAAVAAANDGRTRMTAPLLCSFPARLITRSGQAQTNPMHRWSRIRRCPGRYRTPAPARPVRLGAGVDDELRDPVATRS